MLLRNLEIRLDAVLHRSDWVPTILAARQMINHSHIFVNSRRITLPSFSCRFFLWIFSRKHLITYTYSLVLRLYKFDSDTEVNMGVLIYYNFRVFFTSFLEKSLILEFYSNRLSSSLICIFMSRTNFPSIFVPLVGLVFSRIVVRVFFTYVEFQSIESIIFFSIYL